MDDLFHDRREAGQVLAGLLQDYKGQHGLVIVALPRGGVPVAFEIARALQAPLDVMVVRKLGVPGHEELAMGAIASGGVQVLNEDVMCHLGLTPEIVAAVSHREGEELARRERVFRGERPPMQVEGRPVVLVDDGLATGSTMRAAAAALRKASPSRIVIAVPVAAAESCAELRGEADDVICARTPEPFFGVGQWYRHFEQTTDEEVRELLAAAERSLASGAPGRAA